MKIMPQNDWLLWLVIAWVVPWKGWALWKAARKKQYIWFIVFLIINTFVVLEILYIFIISELKNEKV